MIGFSVWKKNRFYIVLVRNLSHLEDIDKF